VFIIADHSSIHTIGEALVWTASVVVALGLLSRTRPARWLWNHLVVEPTTIWTKKTVGSVVDEKIGLEFAPNSGTSLRDVVDALHQNQAELMGFASESAERQEAIEIALTKAIEAGAGRDDLLQQQVANTSIRITALDAKSERVFDAISDVRRCVRANMGNSSKSAET